MKLQVDLDMLQNKVKEMGAEDRDFILVSSLADIDPIDIALEKGIAINAADIDYISNGLLSYKGRQVLLYIQDHSWNISHVLKNGSKGKKYHVAYCKTLEEMHSKGRFERYVVKNDMSGLFFITGEEYIPGSKRKRHIEGSAELNICKNCLKYLNYKGYQEKSKQSEIFNNFSLEEFFKTYHSHFKHKPKRIAGSDRDGTYTKDWSEISRFYRSSVSWVCEGCGVNLVNQKDLLHTHHRDGVKSNNATSNLQALCIECHSKQPNHHIKVTSLQKEQLKRLRTLHIT